MRFVDANEFLLLCGGGVWVQPEVSHRCDAPGSLTGATMHGMRPAADFVSVVDQGVNPVAPAR